jgi:GT2 family glycosyltransferase
MSAVPETVPVSVVVPTIGRTSQLRACLESLARCSPRAEEIVVIDQSPGDEIEELGRTFAPIGLRVVRSHPPGVARARNEGLRQASHETVLMTDDDCTVAPDWVGTGKRLLDEDRSLIVSGRVLPGAGGGTVPSTKADTARHDYTGTLHCGVLFTNNVALNAAETLALGAFDEDFETAEDNDLCYRWLASGRRLVYEPSLLVWHHDWRTPRQLRRLYVSYWRGQGALYAKHVAAGDRRMLRLMAHDVYWGARALASRAVGRRAAWTERGRGMVRGLPAGIASYLLRRRASAGRARAGGT